jgi:Cupredoxin-like domain
LQLQLSRISIVPAETTETAEMRTLFLAAALAVLLPLPARADDAPTVTIMVEHRHFVPADVPVPAGRRVELVIDNRDPTPLEFESTELRREKLVVAHGKASLWVGPLPAGSYGFFDDFGQVQPPGRLIAR